MNDFILKALVEKFKSLGYENFEYFSHAREYMSDLGYYFKIDIEGNTFYFSYHSSKKSMHRHIDFICEEIQNFFNIYNKDKSDLDIDDFELFIRDQAICKVCFDDKINYSFPGGSLDLFCKKMSDKYIDCKEFMEHIGELDLVCELQAIEMVED